MTEADGRPWPIIKEGFLIFGFQETSGAFSVPEGSRQGLNICTLLSLEPIHPSGDLCLVPHFPGDGERMGLVVSGAEVCDTLLLFASELLASTATQAGLCLLLSLAHGVELKEIFSTLASLGKSSEIQ